MREVFAAFEAADGRIAARDIADVLRALDENPTQADIRRVTQHFSPDDRVNFEEFMSVYEQITKVRLAETAEDFIESFRHFDKKGNGTILAEDIIELLTKYGETMTREEVDDLLQGLVDIHGSVNIEELVKKIMTYEDDEEDPRR